MVQNGTMTVHDVDVSRRPSVRFDLTDQLHDDYITNTRTTTPASCHSSNCSKQCSKHVTSSKYSDPKNLNLSFAGCGFLCVYHAGVCAAIKEYAPQLISNKVYGASAGAIVGAGLLCNVCVSAAISLMLQAVSQAQKGTLKTLSPSFDLSGIVRDGLEKMLPQNAHELCYNRLFISLTRWHDRANVMVSDFNTRAELIDAIVCSSFIPVLCGLRRPTFRGVEYVDGGLSDNQPMASTNTITVSPFSGEHDICPTDHDSASLLGIDFSNTNIRLTTGNLFRMVTCFFPPSLDICSKICRQGFQDALVLLTRKGLAPCVRCLTIQSNVLPVPEYRTDMPSRNRSTSMVSNPSRIRLESECELCYESEINPEDATALFPSVLQTAIDEAKKAESRIFRYLNSFRIFRWSRYMMTPALIPLDFMVYSFKTLQYWLYPKSAVDFFFQRLQDTSDLVASFLETQTSTNNNVSCRFSVADVERRQSMNPATKRQSISSKKENPYLVLEQNENEVSDEGSVNELVKYSMEHDAVLAYYYMDHNNEVQVCEIFDVNSPDRQRPCHSSQRSMIPRRLSAPAKKFGSNQSTLSIQSGFGQSAFSNQTPPNSAPPALIPEEREDSESHEEFHQGHYNDFSDEPINETNEFIDNDEDEPQPTMEMELLCPQSPISSNHSPLNGEDSGFSLTEDSNLSSNSNVKKRDACCSPIRSGNNNHGDFATSPATKTPKPATSLHSNRPSRTTFHESRPQQSTSRGTDRWELDEARNQSVSTTQLNRRHTTALTLKRPQPMGSNKSINSGPAAFHYWPPQPLSSDSDQDANDTFFVPQRARSASSNAYDAEREESDTDQN